MSQRFLLPAALAFGLIAAPASAFLSRNNLLVVPEGRDTFNIPFRGKSGDSEFWCAAGDYVQNFLRLPANTRIWRLSEPPRRRGEGIQNRAGRLRKWPAGQRSCHHRSWCLSAKVQPVQLLTPYLGPDLPPTQRLEGRL
jgi:hypothetical protein